MGNVVKLKNKKQILIDCLKELIQKIETEEINADKMAMVLKDEKEQLAYTIYHNCDFADKQYMLNQLQNDIVDTIIQMNIKKYLEKI